MVGVSMRNARSICIRMTSFLQSKKRNGRETALVITRNYTCTTMAGKCHPAYDFLSTFTKLLVVMVLSCLDLEILMTYFC